MITLLPLLAAWTLAVISPGPDFAVTLQTAAAHRRRAGLLTAAGVVSGIAVWIMTAMLGLTALLERYQHLYQVLRTAGAVFLLGYGLYVLWHAWRSPSPSAEPSAAATAAPRSGVRQWRLGLLTNLANPKAVVFFGALFASLLPPHTTVATKAVLVAVMLAMALAWFALVALAASTSLVTSLYRRARRAVDTLTGAVLTTTGAALIPR